MACAHIRDAHVPRADRAEVARSGVLASAIGVARCSATCSARFRPHRRLAVSACWLAMCLWASTHARSGASFPVMNPGGGGGKPFQKTSAKRTERIFAGAFFSLACATCRGLKDPSRPTGQLYESLSGIGEGGDKGFPEGVARRIADLGARRRDCVSSRLRQGIEQPAAQYAASRAHAGLQLRRARQLEVFRGEDVPSTST
jgi:hypothetical protein